MLGIIKQIFSKPGTIEENAEDEDFLTQKNPNFLTDPEKIIKLLSEIEASGPLCTIQIEGASESYNSSILGIKLDKNLILLDELVPKEGNAELQRCKALKFLTFHKGIHLSFFLTSVELGFSRGISFYKAAIPDRIYYPQRRRAPRIEISSIDIAFTGTAEKSGVSISGFVYDLSRGGAGIDLPANRARLQRGDKIKNCQISFEDYEMDFDFDVRFIKQVSTGSTRVQIGGLFEKLSSKSQTKLSYFITSLERSEIRRQKF